MKRKKAVNEVIHNFSKSNMPTATDAITEYYGNQLFEMHANNMAKLSERKNETGECCFDTALKGSKVFQKIREK